jgi:hypothetical protein
VLRDLDGTDVGVWNAGVLSLSAGVPAQHVRIAEEARRGIPVHLLRNVGVWVRIVAEAVPSGVAVVAMTARDRKRHHHAIADLQIFDLLAGVYDLPHKLVTENVPFFHRGDVAFVEVKVGAADGGKRDVDDRVPRVHNFRVGDLFDLYVVGALPAKCFHTRYLRSMGRE